MKKFRKFFTFKNLNSKNLHSYQTWEQSNYQKFMIFFLQRLEPLQLQKDEIIYGELQSVDMIVFLMEG